MKEKAKDIEHRSIKYTTLKLVLRSLTVLN